MQLEDTQPLLNLVTIKDIFPTLSSYFFKPKPDFRGNFKRALFKELNIKMYSDESRKDPFLILGYGVNAYIEILTSFSCMFLAVTLFAIPIYFIYLS
jgi:hypothetical protein